MSGAVQKITLPDLGRLPAFCHATVAGGFVYVSGTLGTEGEGFKLVERLIQELEEVAKVEQNPSMQGRRIVVTFAPK